MTTQRPLMTTLATRRLGALLATLLAGAALAGPAQAADFVVTNPNDSGAGSLRQAILDANGNGAADTITFAPTLAGGTISLSGGQLIADDTAGPDLTIDGDLDDDGTPDITVDAQGDSQVFVISLPAADATLQGLVITGGGTGGILNFGTLTVTNSTISGNSGGSGGSIQNFATLTVANSTISRNSAGFGGGINNSGGTLTVANTTISDNTATASGGGIENGASGGNCGTLTVTNSTISGNSATANGGGIQNCGTLTVTNSTISGNSADVGGGIANLSTLAIEVEVEGSTISGNSARVGGGIRNATTLQIKSTIVAGNTAVDCVNDGTLTSQGFNLEGGTSCGFTEDGDKQNVAVAAVLVTAANGAPLLADNGGPTQTIALLDTDTNPALDAIPLADCDVDTDQRGVTRPQPADGNCDIGAFELVQEAPITIADVIELFDAAVADGTLMGAGPGNSARGRLGALRNMLLAAGDLLEQGDVDAACTQLQDVANRTDGAFPPPDFVQGEAAPDLLDAVTELQDELGCFA